MITISVANRQRAVRIDKGAIRRAAVQVLAAEGVASAQISVAVVDDRTSREVNRRHLEHDYPTDVISFPLDDDAGCIEGELVINAELAAEWAAHLGWPATDELLLYVVHGLLHLAGYDDHTPTDRARMRRRERFHLAALGIDARYRRRKKSPSPSGRGSGRGGSRKDAIQNARRKETRPQ